jgi:hypothetical protein
VPDVLIGAGTAMTPMVNSWEYRFSFHGVPLRYLTSSSLLCASTGPWTRFLCQAEKGGDVPLTVQFETVLSRDAVPVTLSSAARRVFSGTMPALGSSLRALWQCEVYRDGQRLVVDVRDQALLLIEEDRAYGYFFRPEVMPLDRLEMFFQCTLMELLKGRNMFPLHAAALEYQGRGVLIPGGHGCGKTTALLSLLRAGYRYLADEHALLRDNGSAQELLATPMKVDVTDDTIAMFPELRTARVGLLRQGVYRKSFHAEDGYPGSCGHSCQPAMIIFPEVTNMSHSCLEPMAKSRALEELLSRLSSIHDTKTAAREFQALSRLVQRTACYRLHFGHDVSDLPRLITPLLERH